MLSVSVRQMQGVCVLYCTISVSQAACIAVSCRILINLPFSEHFHATAYRQTSKHVCHGFKINTKSNC